MGKRGRSANKDNRSFKRIVRDEEDMDDDDDTQLTGLAAKIARQQKFLWEKMGGAEDEMDDEEEEENNCAVWSRSKGLYYGADEATSSDEQLLAEEEAEVIRMQREKAKSMSIADFSLEEDFSKDNIDREPTLGEIEGEGNVRADLEQKLRKKGKGKVRADLEQKLREKGKGKVTADLEQKLREKGKGKVTADLEQKLREKGKGTLSSTATKGKKNTSTQKPVNWMLESREDFDDDGTAAKQLGKGNASLSKPSKLNKYKAQSMEMLKVRAALEEKWRQHKFISSASPSKRVKNERKLKPINGMFETLDDFDDDVTGIDVTGHGLREGNASLSKNINSSLRAVHNKPKIMSGDYDLPKRDDIGERRRKHELRVLSRAGIEAEDEARILDHSDSKKSGSEESENEFYEQVKQQRAAKLAAKAEKYSRTSRTQALPEIVDGRRPITYQMEKNGLTRYRKKITKNPRKKYRTKHQTALVRRKGQVREVRRPYGPYGGEASGINPEISRSIRFNY